MGKISKEEVRHIAKLAEIEFSEDEIEKFTIQLGRILEHVAKISEVDTKNIPPTSHIIEIKNVFRDDIVKKSLSKEEALANAPEVMNGGFKVPKID
ncbi:MAG: Asp-tRNA(Asn)/Glu-tRNA(Gln) amidotransferase subunit GatC [Actinobacteria bacterium]|nr:Asp-tRNA(Asn)/Glu-tRNA(Gln) amidotransferase subunit GatC [Actinomycetota bacterium]